MMIMDIAISSKWVSGNTFNPTHETVKALKTWEQLSPKQQKDHLEICHWETQASMAGREFVLYRPHGRVGGIWATERSTFEATRYATVDEMIAVRAANQAPLTSLPGARFSGEG